MSCVTIMMPPIVMACSETQSQAPKKRTVICEMEPAASAMTEMPFSQRRFACLASSSSVLEARKRLSAGPSALKLLIWANPVDGKVFYRRCGKDSFQVHGNDFFLTRDKE